MPYDFTYIRRDVFFIICSLICSKYSVSTTCMKVLDTNVQV